MRIRAHTQKSMNKPQHYNKMQASSSIPSMVICVLLVFFHFSLSLSTDSTVFLNDQVTTMTCDAWIHFSCTWNYYFFFFQSTNEIIHKNAAAVAAAHINLINLMSVCLIVHSFVFCLLDFNEKYKQSASSPQWKTTMHIVRASVIEHNRDRKGKSFRFICIHI